MYVLLTKLEVKIALLYDTEQNYVLFYNSTWKYIEKEKINNVDKIKKAWLILRTYSILKYIKIIF